METGFQFIGLGLFAWLIYGGPQKVVEAWSKGKQSSKECCCRCRDPED